MHSIVLICLLITLGYVLLMIAYCKGWANKKDFVLPPNYEPCTFISVIIPARNEQKNIGACIESILAQKYPAYLFEIIVVNDHSEDNTAKVVDAYAGNNVRCLNLSDYLDADTKTIAYKKAALAAGIAQSKGTLIVTTDADCIAPNSWLLHIAAIYEQEMATMVVAPVIYTSDHSLVQVFQLIDFMSMQGITAAAHSLKLGNMSNGANLAFRKATYELVEGYSGIDHLASGDDLLLMMKLNKSSPGGISYLKSAKAIVSTAPQPDWRSFFQQRIRWASKSGKYNDGRLTAILLLVYLFNCAFLVLAIAGFFSPALFYLLAGILAVKIIAEYIFLVPVARFFGEEWVLRYFFFLQPLHISYIVIAGFLGFIGGYKWKGRSVK
jgi:cellulose synthase/poly-beta-1,6-N-acetylglucosamine synthase-like glycosyltransferase